MVLLLPEGVDGGSEQSSSVRIPVPLAATTIATCATSTRTTATSATALLMAAATTALCKAKNKHEEGKRNKKSNTIRDVGARA